VIVGDNVTSYNGVCGELPAAAKSFETCHRGHAVMWKSGHNGYRKWSAIQCDNPDVNHLGSTLTYLLSMVQLVHATNGA